MFDPVRGKTVLITGHTGFKGSWLAVWLRSLGANVVGLALEPPTSPSHFEAATLAREVADYKGDVRDFQRVNEVVQETQPDFVFHLAAQPLVRQSYDEPVQTFETNVLGTLHLLEALRGLGKTCTAVFITSDKCYDNVEWEWGYRETDALGGPDPYSGSKGAAELAIRSYVRSFFTSGSSPARIAVARAGNVIGGGDWASDRIVPDCVRAWSRGEEVELRNPQATRPWQHVLEPLSGYLALATALTAREELHGEAFNFGPPSHQNHSVRDLVESMGRHWEQVRWCDASGKGDEPHESGLLKLNCDKALQRLQWRPTLDFDETVQLTAEWYREYYGESSSSILDLTSSQIAGYVAQAKQRGLAWAQQ
jgi:CDP-glucose 4,6-dehydratase